MLSIMCISKMICLGTALHGKGSRENTLVLCTASFLAVVCPELSDAIRHTKDTWFTTAYVVRD